MAMPGRFKTNLITAEELAAVIDGRYGRTTLESYRMLHFHDYILIGREWQGRLTRITYYQRTDEEWKKIAAVLEDRGNEIELVVVTRKKYFKN